MYASLSGCKALVSGGSGGIGSAVVQALLDEGAMVAVIDRNRPGDDGRIIFVEADLRREHDIVRGVRTASDRLRGIDLYVNCAAVRHPESVEELTLRHWNEMLEVNLTACALVCREVAQQMREQRRGSILIIGSTAVGTPGYREAGYRASKAGLKALMEVLAIELAPWGIRVNMLTPGPFPTGLVEDMTPGVNIANSDTDSDVPCKLGVSSRPRGAAQDLPNTHRRDAAMAAVPLGAREGHVQELQGAAVLLLSDRLSSYTTGSELMVDGGLHLRPIGVEAWGKEHPSC